MCNNTGSHSARKISDKKKFHSKYTITIIDLTKEASKIPAVYLLISKNKIKNTNIPIIALSIVKIKIKTETIERTMTNHD